MSLESRKPWISVSEPFDLFVFKLTTNWLMNHLVLLGQIHEPLILTTEWLSQASSLTRIYEALRLTTSWLNSPFPFLPLPQMMLVNNEVALSPGQGSVMPPSLTFDLQPLFKVIPSPDTAVCLLLTDQEKSKCSIQPVKDLLLFCAGWASNHPFLQWTWQM